MDPFTFALADPHDPLGGCDIRAPLTITFTRNAATEIKPTLDLEELASFRLVKALDGGFPLMKAWSDGELIANCVWAPMQEDVPDDPAPIGTLAGSFKDPLSLLDGRYTPDGGVSYTAEDMGAMAWDLIDTTNTTEGFTGIEQGTIETTTSRDQAWDQDKQLSEAITDLSQLEPGIDFEVAPVDEGTTLGLFNVYQQQGEDKSVAALGRDAVIFEFGGLDNVRSVNRQTSRPVNSVKVRGADGLTGLAKDQPSIDRYGTCMSITQASDVSDQGTLDDRAQALLRPEPVRVVSFTLDPVRGPRPRRDFWLGDVVQFRAKFGAMVVDIPVRVNAIPITIDREGNVASISVAIEDGI